MAISQASFAASTVYRLLALGCTVLVLFRLLGVFFFADSLSLWLVGPAGVLVLMLIVTAKNPGPAWMVMAALVLYALSYWHAGWDRLMLRLSEGGDPFPDLPELALLLLLLGRWFALRMRAKPRA